MTFYHGGKAGLAIGDAVVPAPPHVEDGCPVCVARREGRTLTVGEYRRWLQQFGPKAEPVLNILRDAPDWAPVDPPSARQAVYVTTSLEYAMWYAARSRGDLYQVKPIGELEPSPEDHFPTFTVSRAVVVAVLRRAVALNRTERRRILHLWKKADARAARAKECAQ